jgi:hypothetical protein
MKNLNKIISADWKKTNKDLVVLASNFFLGVALGAIGKQKNLPEVYTTLPLFDLVSGGNCLVSGTIPYLLGVTLNYAPEICQKLI